MSTFKFNFSKDEETETQDAYTNNETIEWLESRTIIPSFQIEELDRIAERAKMFTCGDVEIGHIDVSKNTKLQQINSSNPNNILSLAEEKHSDLVTGKYEGGLKIWECTSDLIEYLQNTEENINFQNKKVLDLGCGAGILGIHALINGSSVIFQDYNSEVLEYVTIPNVLLNIEEEERESEIKKCQFYSGDWASFNAICDDVFDIILTSETIYNESNYEKLIKLFVDKLSNNGVIYVAAKTYYFGVGGGTRQFKQSIKNNRSLKYTVCWKSSGGIQREILKITKGD